MNATSTTDDSRDAAGNLDEPKGSGAGGDPRWGFAALLFCALCGVAFAASLLAYEVLHLSLLPACAVFVLLGKVVVDALATRLRAPHLPIATGLGAIFVATGLAVTQWDALAAQLDQLDPSLLAGERLFGGALGLVAMFVFLPVMGFCAGAAAARLAARPSFQRACRRVAAFGTFALGSLVVLAAARAVQHPCLDDYLENLKYAGHLSPPGVVTGYGGVSGPTPVAWGPGPAGERRQEVGSFTAVLRCGEAGCRIGLRGAAGVPDSMVDAPAAPLQKWDAAITLERDPMTGALFVLSGHGASRQRRAIAEFHDHDGSWSPAPFDPGRITRRASPRWEWILGGGGGLFLAGVGWLACLGQRRARTRLRRAREGMLGPDRWITFPSAPAVQLVARSVLSPGPVLVLAHPALDGYRSQPQLSSADVLAGTLADHETDIAERLLGWHAAIVAVATLAGAPLAAAALVGLVL